ncbi:MAG: TIM-barrel domain-containing protein [Halanaerobiales bacterium]
MTGFIEETNKIKLCNNKFDTFLQSWGKNCIRVRKIPEKAIPDLPEILSKPVSSNSEIIIEKEKAVLKNGEIKAVVAKDGGISFFKTKSENMIMEEISCSFKNIEEYDHLYEAKANFTTSPQEKFYGLGQHTKGNLNLKGETFELKQTNTEVNIPFLLSNKNYGFLWNNPALGEIKLQENNISWTARVTSKIDYLVFTGNSFPEIYQSYTETTGRAPEFPEWAAGFWQSKNRYTSQEEVISIAREYKKRDLPISTIVIDYFYWNKMGNFDWDREKWPYPEKMVDELKEMGIKPVISIWPTVNKKSDNFKEMKEKDFFIHKKDNSDTSHKTFVDGYPPDKANLFVYDATNPEAREYIWNKIRKNYYDKGINAFWLDAMEPEVETDQFDFYLGQGEEVANLYPLKHAEAFYKGMKEEGQKNILNLCRSGWIGSQKYGAAIWSGDIPSTFESLQKQVRAGLNIALSGIPWWTSDIGGYHGGDPESSYMRELIVRWFQFGAFCPLFRLHGARDPRPSPGIPGAANEVWSYGEKAYKIIKNLLFMRERLKPYIMQQMKLASEKGIPVMKPLFFDFPEDKACYEIEDEFLFGPDILVAPVLKEGLNQRKVYLPDGSDWIKVADGKRYDGNQYVNVKTPLATIPLFLKNNNSNWKKLRSTILG